MSIKYKLTNIVKYIELLDNKKNRDLIVLYQYDYVKSINILNDDKIGIEYYNKSKINYIIDLNNFNSLEDINRFIDDNFLIVNKKDIVDISIPIELISEYPVKYSIVDLANILNFLLDNKKLILLNNDIVARVYPNIILNKIDISFKTPNNILSVNINGVEDILSFHDSLKFYESYHNNITDKLKYYYFH